MISIQDNETHFLLGFKLFEVERVCFMNRLKCFVPNIEYLSEENQIKTMLCPSSPQAAKLVNKFIGIMFRARENIDKGINLLLYPTWDPMQANPFISNTLDVSSCSSETISELSMSFVSSSDLQDLSF